MDEREAIARLKQGNISGLDALVCKYQLQAVRAAYLVCGDRSVAEDVVQSTFVRAYERIEQFDATRPFGPWFLRSVVNDAIKAADRDQRHISLDADDDGISILDLLAEPSPTPDEAIEAAQAREAVRAALQKLSPSQRAIVVQRYFLDLKDEEIANEQAIAPGTVKAHMHAARQRLRALLSWFGGES
jgi:RNA polymerase sigma-70 factor (ECF subfamily)